MFKAYLQQQGKYLIFELRDVFTADTSEMSNIPISENCKLILSNIIDNRNYDNITEEQCRILFKEFIEPVTYKDIDLMSIDPFFVGVHNACGHLWTEAPNQIQRGIYNS